MNQTIRYQKKEEKLENDSISSQSEDFDGDYNDIPLFDRIIEDEGFRNYKDIISDLKIKSGKRSEMINDNEDFIDLPLELDIETQYGIIPITVNKSLTY